MSVGNNNHGQNLPTPKRSSVVKVLHWGDEPATIRCLIGNLRFKSEFEGAAKVFSLRGEIVLTPNVYTTTDGMDKDEAEMLHELALKRIDMSDIVYVINPNNRMTENVHKEIEYAESLGRVVRYLETPSGR